MALTSIIKKLKAVLHSQRGHNFLIFLCFLAIATVLWFVMTLNDEEQCDVRLPLRFTHIPDSVTIITTPPQSLSVSLRARGSQRLKLAWMSSPAVDIDFRLFRTGNALHLSNTDLKAAVRSAVDGATIVLVSPDSLNLLYTTDPGTPMPVIADFCVTAGPKSSLIGSPTLSVDSVKVYSVDGLPAGIEAVATKPIRFTGLTENTTTRVALVPPPGTRVIPDSVDVTFNVEPLILKTRTVAIEPVNVPADMRLITFPARVNVIYMIAMSDYKVSEPTMRVIADYRTIDGSRASRNIRLKLVDVSDNIQNVYLEADSAEYIIEHL